ncbi:hypothetical protein TraAM80_09499 [Trypanosoma rangeli]|uniref:Uncharacterized protein n=1 Tax=Trypanosoma rangeli TaxID=5698 RepID=A0A422MV70_TRYRA|nr:uncharacterized protein TraAM80_09499 [Trypanosoma rangeli]RNE97132.1 hypothetical protein TraAM80_09499 [Trypanosoma rangeli]|eukprot:RNE97132.1 hypothetical protein TraAM80_09499 [Trypanosoma rangeli]
MAAVTSGGAAVAAETGTRGRGPKSWGSLTHVCRQRDSAQLSGARWRAKAGAGMPSAAQSVNHTALNRVLGGSVPAGSASPLVPRAASLPPSPTTGAANAGRQNRAAREGCLSASRESRIGSRGPSALVLRVPLSPRQTATKKKNGKCAA